MLTLYSASASPFGRKVKIAASLLGLSDQITVLPLNTSDPNDPLREKNPNPLGKIPCLVDEKGMALYDSAVIVDYLDFRAGGGKLIPIEPSARYRALVNQALADGLMEAALLLVYEKRYRAPENHEKKWTSLQAAKVDKALGALTSAPPQGPRDIGHVATACALGYLDLRFEGHWRPAHPGLVAWLDAFDHAVPSFAATRHIEA
jgi:glutathione S-transferase